MNDCQHLECDQEAILVVTPLTDSVTDITYGLHLCLDHHILFYGNIEDHNKVCECGEIEKIERQRRLEAIPSNPKSVMGEIKLSRQPVFATTGHRAPVTAVMYDKAQAFVEYVKSMKGIVLNGGAEGWDHLVGFYCSDLKVPFKLYLPFESSKSKLLGKITTAAQEIIITGGKAFQSKEDLGEYQNRNEMMVDLADQLHSYHDGRKIGGTKNCVDYARRKGVKIKNWFPSELSDLI